MDDGLQMGIVVIEDMACHAVEEGRVHDVEPFATAEQAGLRRAGKGRQGRHRDIQGLVVRPADGDADPVQQRTDALLAHIGRQIVVACRDDVVRQRLVTFLPGALAGAAA